jgi:hypothetical protein
VTPNLRPTGGAAAGVGEAVTAAEGDGSGEVGPAVGVEGVPQAPASSATAATGESARVNARLNLATFVSVEDHAFL